MANLSVHGSASLHELFGDLVVYRNLVPVDGRIPTLDELRPRLGLAKGVIPRKAEPDYGRVVAAMLQHARRLTLPGRHIARLLYIGDTPINDGTAFHNLCAAGGWPGWAFIGHDAPEQPPEVKIEGDLYLSNRWAALPDFLNFVKEQGLALDEETALVIDVDKTAIGARGRNDRVINEARVEGVERTVSGLLGPEFDREAFHRAYEELNQSAYYSLTADNQDYLAYICLMLGAGLFELDEVVRRTRTGELRCFHDFIAQVQARRAELSADGLLPIHDDVWRRVQAGDPTPFKAFRYNEYLTTVARFGDLPGASVDELLARRIVITQEVRQAAAVLRARGALIFALSDKPDEASLPNEQQARAGMQPIHRLETPVVGDDRRALHWPMPPA